MEATLTTTAPGESIRMRVGRLLLATSEGTGLEAVVRLAATEPA